jgi:drug/metabolite transporter (DMT)-like permease
MITPVTGYILALITACCWAQNSVAYSIAGKRVTSHTVTHVRLWFAFPALLLVHFLFLRSFFPAINDVEAFWFLAVSGFTGFFITDICIFKAFVDLGPREGMVMMSLAPILTVIFAWIFLDENLSILQLLGIAVTVGGVVWVILEEGQKRKEDKNLKLVQGVVAGLTGALMQAISMVLAKSGMVGEIHPISGNVVRVAFGLLGLIAFSLVRRQFVNDFRKMKDRKALALIGTSAMIGPVLGMICALFALSAAEAGIVTTFMQVTPVILIPVDIFVFKKKLTYGAVVGTIMAVAGAAILFAVG